MKIMNYFMFLLVLLLFIPARSEAAGTIQSKIDEAKNGATIEIGEGEYEETLVINKPIILKGKGEVLLRSCLSEPVVTISGESVTFKNVKVEHCGDEQEDTAIYVTGSNHKLEGITIKTKRYGIRLDHANDVTVQDSEIVGRNRGNGIDLWKSNQNQFENIKITNARDGIYIERSNKNTIHKNDIQLSRYGLHLMFSNENVLDENASRENITGIMLMESKRTVVSNNKFLSNNKSVNAQGLLIYVSTNTEVIGNEFISNRIAILIEEAEKNRIDHNKISDNFIGLQFKKANENTVISNTFVGNVNDSQAIESANNKYNGNYWDAASKIDVNGDGESEIVYSADPYFLALTNAVPEYQLFFQTPGLLLLQNVLKSPADQLLTDSAPLMNMTMKIEKEKSTSFSLWVISIVMILSSLSLFIFGRKRE